MNETKTTEIVEKRIRKYIPVSSNTVTKWFFAEWQGVSDKPCNLTVTVIYRETAKNVSRVIGSLSEDTSKQTAVFRVSGLVSGFQLDIDTDGAKCYLHCFRITSKSRVGTALSLLSGYANHKEVSFLHGTMNVLQIIRKYGKYPALGALFSATRLIPFEEVPSVQNLYENWMRHNDVTGDSLVLQERESTDKKMTIHFRILVFYDTTTIENLRDTIQSICAQTYPLFSVEIISGERDVPGSVFENMIRNGQDIRVTSSFHSLCNQMLPSEDFVLFFRAGDHLAQHALFSIMKAAETFADADLVYSDHDMFQELSDGKPKYRTAPVFKPDFSPYFLIATNYIGSCFAVRTKNLCQGTFSQAIGGAAFFHDYLLRVTDSVDNVIHVPDILWHQRQQDKGTVCDNCVSVPAMCDKLKRMNIQARILIDPPKKEFARISPELTNEPLVSIIIPNKDHREDLQKCLDSIRKAEYRNYEVLIIENNSTNEDIFSYYQTLTTEQIHVIPYNDSFNFAKMHNMVVPMAKGEYIVMLNNDTEILSATWLHELLLYAMQPDVGIVGARLLYPDRTIQHAGVIVGLQGLAGHSFVNLSEDDGGYMCRCLLPQNVSAVTGACMMMRKSLYTASGGMDESLAVAYNDIDLCLRMIAMGFTNVYTPYALLMHYESKSRGAEDSMEKMERIEKERRIFQETWRCFLEYGDPYYNINLTKEVPGGYLPCQNEVSDKLARTSRFRDFIFAREVNKSIKHDGSVRCR